MKEKKETKRQNKKRKEKENNKRKKDRIKGIQIPLGYKISEYAINQTG